MITSPSCAWRGQFGYHFRCLKSAHTFSLVGAYPAHTWTPFCGHRPHIFASKPTIQLHSKPAKPGSPNQPQGASQPASQPGSSQQAGQQARTRRPLSNFKPLDAATPVIVLLFIFDFWSFYWSFELISNPPDAATPCHFLLFLFVFFPFLLSIWIDLKPLDAASFVVFSLFSFDF